MFVRCHAIETDFANQTTAAAIVIVPASKPTKAIVGNSTNSIVLLRDGQHHGYKMLVACASCDRRKSRKMVAHIVTVEPVSGRRNSLLTGKTTGNLVETALFARF